MGRNPDKLECDLVMRGGITSGIVYPRAIAKLAEKYDFRCIGGTSAGAIAATATAAAAYGRKHGEDHFQTDIKGLPARLGTKKKCKTELERLFQPQPETGRLFKVLMSGLGRENKAVKIARIAATLCLQYWPLALLGAAIALIPLLAFAKTSTLGGLLFLVLFILGLVSAAAFVLLMAAAGGLCDILCKLPKHGYGMCSGSSNMQPDEAGVLPLTDWLHEYFQKVANRPLDKPVTFGDLWGTKDETNPRDIELVLMTTNVTRGISQRLPFIEGSWGQLFFNKAEFDGLFPESVVTALYENRAVVRYADRIEVPDGYYPLPEAPNLPILLGARMSLSFPFLLSAVPLYAADATNKSPDGKMPLQKCWFSDGGLTSNFPIHFFDAPLPTRPTFGINLAPASVKLAETKGDGDDEDEFDSVLGSRETDPENPWHYIYMPSRNSSGIGTAARFNKFEGSGGSVTGFFGALFDTARNWGDTELMALPGYRDRIVHVMLTEDEGGLNLNMPKEVIETVGERGEKAGQLLADRFKPTPKGDEILKDPQTDKDVQLTWDNHRWIRFRAYAAALELALRRLTKAWAESAGETRWRNYADLLARGDDLPKSYKFGSDAQIAFAKDALQRLVAALGGLAGDQTFDRTGKGRSPRPKPILRMMPSGSNDPRSERADQPSGTPPATA
jgi:Patatin-like phospholipase